MEEWEVLLQNIVDTGDRFVRDDSPIEALFDLERRLHAWIMDPRHAQHGAHRVTTWVLYFCLGSLVRQLNNTPDLPAGLRTRFLMQFGEALTPFGEHMKMDATDPRHALECADELVGVYRLIRLEIAEHTAQQDLMTPA